MAEPPPVPPDPDDETVIVPPTDDGRRDLARERGARRGERDRAAPSEASGVLAMVARPPGARAGRSRRAYFFTRDDDNDETTTTSTVATTTAQVTVPDVVGTTSSEATATLRGAGLDANLVSVPSDRSPGTVVAQNPSAGEEVSDGSTVRLNVAEAAKPAPATTAPETTAPTTTPRPSRLLFPTWSARSSQMQPAPSARRD